MIFGIKVGVVVAILAPAMSLAMEASGSSSSEINQSKSGPENFLGQPLNRPGVFNQKTLIVSNIISVDNDGVSYAKGQYRTSSGSGANQLQDISLVCGNDEAIYMNKELLVLKALMRYQKKLENTATGYKYLTHPIHRFEYPQGRCYIISNRCDYNIMNLENAINKDGFYDRSQPGLLSQFTQAIYALRTIGWVYSRYDPENVCINFDANDAPPKFLIKDFKRAILLKPAKSTGNHEESFLEFVNHKTMRQIEITNNILMQKLASFSEDIRNQHAQYYGLNQNTIKEVQTELGHNTPNASGQANRRPEQLPNYHMDDSEPPLYISDRLPEYQDRN